MKSVCWTFTGVLRPLLTMSERRRGLPALKELGLGQGT